MRLVYLGIALIAILMMWPAHAQADGCHVLATVPTYTAGNTVPQDTCDTKTNKYVTLGTLLSGEDPTATQTTTTGVTVVEQRYKASAVVTSDTQVAAGASFLHCVTISAVDAAPTEGDIVIYDSLTESGTAIFKYHPTTAYFVPFQICPNVPMATGIFIGFTTTADVYVSASGRW